MHRSRGSRLTIARPTDLAGALDALGGLPGAQLLAGGTDLMVEVNRGHRRPEGIVALRRVDELRGVEVTDDHLDMGACVTYAQVEADLAQLAPGLAMASRTVGSPQIRNAGTLGGNIGTGSPAGDSLPWLLATDAEIDLVSADGGRTVPLDELLVGPKRTDIAAHEIIHRVRVRRSSGPQHVAKIGPRNAMSIAVASVAVVVDTDARRVRVALGSVGPVPVRAHAAEEAVSMAVDWAAMSCDDDALRAFGRAVAAAASPIDDHRSTAAYRRHAVAVLARRTLQRCLME